MENKSGEVMFVRDEVIINYQAALIREAREIITWAAQPKIDITANECERIGSKIVDWLEKTKEI